MITTGDLENMSVIFYAKKNMQNEGNKKNGERMKRKRNYRTNEIKEKS